MSAHPDTSLLAHLVVRRAGMAVAELDQWDSAVRDLLHGWGITTDDQIHAVLFGLSMAVGLACTHHCCPDLCEQLRRWQAGVAGQLTGVPPC